ncbi:MAG: hypothetical protein AAF518_17685 [Spirochaetota bacterium]
MQKQNVFLQSTGKSDLVLQREGVLRKVSGNAQFRKRDCLVHHGTFILDESIITKISSYLPHPPEEPDYRQQRNHRSFLASLPEKFSAEQFYTDMLEICTGQKEKACNRTFSQWRSFYKSVSRQAKELMLEKYLNPEFIYFRP